MVRKAVTLRDFAGRWSILREIRDERYGVSGRMEGQAHFRPRDCATFAMSYEESGRLMMSNGTTMAAKRSYVWREANEGRDISVEFEDKRPFHKITLNRTMPNDTHFCAPDLYEVTYDLRRWPSWIVEWRVRGPKKNYRLWTRYKFLGDVSREPRPCAGAGAGAVSQPSDIILDGVETWHETLKIKS